MTIARLRTSVACDPLIVSQISAHRSNRYRNYENREQLLPFPVVKKTGIYLPVNDISLLSGVFYVSR